MRINGVNLSVVNNSKRINYVSNPHNNGKEYANSSETKLNNSKNISFGLSEIAIIIIADLLAGATILAPLGIIWLLQKAYDSKVDKKNKEREIEEVKQKRLDNIESIAKKLNITKKQAEKYHDEFLKIAEIPQTNSGNEKGLNAVMGYGNEKYKLAMELLVPIISAQNYQDEQAKKLVPNGLLLYGPTGSGKTYIAEHLSEHLREFGVDYEEIVLDEENHTQNTKNIKEVFENAEYQYKETGKYTVIRFPQDIDDFLTDRSKDNEFIKETRTLLKYAENCSSKGAIWISTANNPKKIDQAILRRATVKMPIGNMQDFQIGDMLKYVTLGIEGKEIANKIDYQKVVDYVRKINQDFTPDEYKIFAETAKNDYGEINAENIIKVIENYYESGLQTLNEEAKAKFQNDQIYVEETDKEDNNGEN